MNAAVRTVHHPLCLAPRPMLIAANLCTWCELIDKVESQRAAADTAYAEEVYASALEDVIDLLDGMSRLQLTRSEKVVIADAIRTLRWGPEA